MSAIQSKRNWLQKPTFGIKVKGKIELPSKATQTYMSELEHVAITWQVLKKSTLPRVSLIRRPSCASYDTQRHAARLE